VQNLTIFATLVTRVGFFEVTGGRALSFLNLSMGGNPARSGKRVKLPRRYVVEKTSPRALELKKSLSSLRKYELCKNIILYREQLFSI